MRGNSCSLLTAGQDEEHEYGLQDYSSGAPRWCPGCGDHAILTGVQRVLEAEQLPPEQTVFVSG
ncbi:MAG: 2-oxoacid:ferredoxin oxidoreductase subunit beta, partial [Deltaproteobacteria bacterium]|nr:2-oxoacid:ferredoxin oxidoreductase subunit beta [Deltaproteobacteria bacterium]